MGWSSSRPRAFTIDLTRSLPNIRIKSSSSDRKNFDAPGSPWRPARPRSWLSIRLDSWRSVPIINSPPSSNTSSCSGWISFLNFSLSSVNTLRAFKISSSSVSPKPVASAISSSEKSRFAISCFARYSALPPSIMSVPRPAIFVAIVTAPFLPAWAMISASFSWYLAFSTLCFIPSFFKSLLKASDLSTFTVPTSTGCPFLLHSFICSITALYFPASVLYTLSCISSRITGLFVGIATISSLYICWNSSSSVSAVPVIPDSFP